MKRQNRAATLCIDLLCDLGGAVLFATGVCCFTAPNQIAPGGVTGIATILNYLAGFPIGITSFVLNLPLLLLALRVWGRPLTLKTLKSVAVLSLVTDLIFPWIPVYTGNPLLAALFGGVCMGSGLAVVFLRGSTTGGTDIIGRYIQTKIPHVQIGRVLLMIDAVILAASALVYSNIETFLYGLAAMYTSSQVMDSILYGVNTGKIAFIVSSEREAIARAVIDKLERGGTFLKGQGAYSDENRDVLLCAVRLQQFPQLKKIVFEIDPNAFVMAVSADEILGYGFKRFENK